MHSERSLQQGTKEARWSTLRLASGHHMAIFRTERWKRIEWSTAQISSLTLYQERNVVHIIWNARVPGRGIRKLEREHGSVVLAREESVLPVVKDGCWGILIDAYLGTGWWDNSAGLLRHLCHSVVAVRRVDPGNRLKRSIFRDFEAEAALVTFGNYPLEHADFRQNGA